MNEIRKQTTIKPDNWLHDGAQDWKRVFSKLIYLGKDAEPWAECTNEEKEEFERIHPAPEQPDEQ